jgi:hypothetical protein
METSDTGSGGKTEDVTFSGAARESARQRVQNRRDLATPMVAYIVINAGLVGAWAVTGSGYFWGAAVMQPSREAGAHASAVVGA